MTRRRVHNIGTLGAKHPLYRRWYAMLQRCRNPSCKPFRNYGARGILVCERWLSFDAFVEDMGMPPTREHSLDRIDNDGNYEPDNCRWATDDIQRRNRRKAGSRSQDTRRLYITHNGERRPLKEWAEITGLTPQGIYARLRNGWPIDRALTVPSAHKSGESVRTYKRFATGRFIVRERENISIGAQCK